jgi:CPA2 family monovalent cation:H+ antiporter-2
VDGQSLGEIELRKRYGVSVLAISRGEKILSNPGAETSLQGNDVIVVLGAPDRITEAIGLFQSTEDGSAST